MEPAIVVQKAYDWVVWIVPKVEKFPKFSRFSIGQSLLTSSLDLLMNLVDATYEARNASSLKAAVREVNRIRYLMRLAKDLRIVNIDSHEFAAKSIDGVLSAFIGVYRRLPILVLEVSVKGDT
jgi:hypothetical protein